ncbi:MAG: hypothetical protein PXY39_12605 [archaeon]|nr:hypothetical protein [archaeon]
MFSKRAILDFLFFSGIFLTAQGILSSSGGLLVSLFPSLPFWFGMHYVGYTFLGHSISNSTIWGFQLDVLITGIVLALASTACMALFRKKKSMVLDGGGRRSSMLPSRRLFADFSFVMGIFLGVAALSVQNTWVFYNGTPNFLDDTALGLFLVSASLILLGTSIYLWYRERKITQGSLGHRLVWEIFTSTAISVLLVFVFILTQGGVGLSLPLQLASLSFLSPISDPLLGFFVLWITLGLYSISREERKLSSSRQETNHMPKLVST